jgi:hypothetical protein
MTAAPKGAAFFPDETEHRAAQGSGGFYLSASQWTKGSDLARSIGKYGHYLVSA